MASLRLALSLDKEFFPLNRAGVREAIEGVVEAVECIRTGASSSPLFLTTD